MRILPDLQASILCEDVRQEASGNFILVGVVGVIRIPQLPISAFKLCVFNRWAAGVGQFTEVVKLLGPDQKVIRQSSVKFALHDASHHATNVSVFTQVEFQLAGVHQIEVIVDDVMKLRYPLPLIVVPPPGQQAASQVPTATGG